MIKLLLIVISLAVMACSSQPDQQQGQQYRDFAIRESASWVSKDSIFTAKGMESTPVVWNGRLTYVISIRGDNDTFGTSIEIWDKQNAALIATHPTTLGFISALVDNGTLYIFGSTNWGKPGNSLYMISTNDLTSWTEPVTLLTADSNTSFFNNSVAPDKNGGFIMAYEICIIKQICFNVNFAHSEDLVSWNTVAQTFGVGFYTACPTIRYSNGFYYVMFLNDFRNQQWGTMISRSTDLLNWQTSPQPIVTPFDGGDIANNTSDLDIVEFNGQTRIIYAIGPQVPMDTTYGGIRQASFNGTLDQFLSSFF